MEKSQFLQVVSTGQRVSSFDESTLEHTLVYLDSSVVRWNMFHYKSANGKSILSLDAMQPSTMQPVHLKTVGYFSHYLTAGPQSASAQLVFSSHGNAVCLFTSRRLDCYLGRPGWSKVFSWSPDRNRLLNSVLLPDTSAQWLITKVMFPPTRPADVGKPFPIALCVLLVNEAQDFSFICYFPDVRDYGQCGRVISTHGLLSACEWIYPLDDCEVTTTSPESGTILAESMDLSHCEPKRIPTLKSVVPSFSGCLAVGFRQGFVSLLGKLHINHPYRSNYV
ncbi:hypothetical protein AHF37_12156 [Paragonimus kellicotti]|nr:hypothetical protein AHF37_12156 [Paragonimus kellicotti]